MDICLLNNCLALFPYVDSSHQRYPFFGWGRSTVGGVEESNIFIKPGQKLKEFPPENIGPEQNYKCIEAVGKPRTRTVHCCNWPSLDELPDNNPKFNYQFCGVCMRPSAQSKTAAQSSNQVLKGEDMPCDSQSELGLSLDRKEGL